MTLFTKKNNVFWIQDTGYFTSDNEPNGIKNAPHNIFSKKPDILISVASFFRKCSVGLIFIPLGSLSLVKYSVLYSLAIVLGVNPFLNTIFSFYRNCICFLFSIASSISCMRQGNRIFSSKLYGIFISQKNSKQAVTTHKVYAITMATRLKRNWSKTQV
jgi:hypothetical protein